jgi:hypothetical protein
MADIMDQSDVHITDVEPGDKEGMLFSDITLYTRIA